MPNAECQVSIEPTTPKFTRGEFNLIESKPNGTIWIEYDAVPRPNIHTIIGAVYPAPYMQGREPISFEEARANAQLWANAHKLYDSTARLVEAFKTRKPDTAKYFQDVIEALVDCGGEPIKITAEAQAEAANSQN